MTGSGTSGSVPDPTPTHDSRATAVATAERVSGATGPAGDTDIAEYALRLGDDALILAQRTAEWISRAPELEEDVALANIGLDLLGQARALLSYAGSLTGRTEDDLAYFRTEQQFRCAHLMSLPRGDFAVTIVRMLIVSGYQCELYARLAGSLDQTLAGIAAKAVKEVTYHFDHARDWTIRLGDGTEESHRRMVLALQQLWPYVEELFRTDELEARLVSAGVAVESRALREPFDARLAPVLTEATLQIPAVPAAAGGGRHGEPGEHLGHLLAEMQVLARRFPGASW